MKSYISFFLLLVCHICYFWNLHFIYVSNLSVKDKYLSQFLLLISSFVAVRLCHVYNVINYSYFVLFYFFTQMSSNLSSPHTSELILVSSTILYLHQSLKFSNFFIFFLSFILLQILNFSLFGICICSDIYEIAHFDEHVHFIY